MHHLISQPLCGYSHSAIRQKEGLNQNVKCLLREEAFRLHYLREHNDHNNKMNSEIQKVGGLENKVVKIEQFNFGKVKLCCVVHWEKNCCFSGFEEDFNKEFKVIIKALYLKYLRLSTINDSCVFTLIVGSRISYPTKVGPRANICLPRELPVQHILRFLPPVLSPIKQM